jgi:hypothetical protein
MKDSLKVGYENRKEAALGILKLKKVKSLKDMVDIHSI